MSAEFPIRRRSLLRASTGLMIGAALSGLSRQALAQSLTAAQGIRRLSGQVTVNGLPARQGMPIRPGDTVVTGTDGDAVYVVGGDAFLQRSGSRVSFGESGSAATAGAANIMRVVSGRLLSVFAKGEKSIWTPTATIGIRGTGCYIEAEAERVYFCLCYGEAELVPSAAPSEREVVRTKHHDHPMYIHNDMKMPKRMVPAEVINHEDAELTLLEGLVGRRPPFEGSRY